jgi:AcrR family transcriptional regulator
VARGEATRQEFIDTVVELLRSGVPCPTAHRSRSLIYRYFMDIDGLLLSAVEQEAMRHDCFAVPLPPTGPLDHRISITCQHRRALFESLGPVLRMAYSRAPDVPDLSEFLSCHREGLRAQLAVTFTPEIERRRPGDSQHLLDALHHTTGWERWQALRINEGHSPSQAARQTMFEMANFLR